MLALRAPRMVSPFGVSGEDALAALSPVADTRAFRGPFHTLEKMSEHALGDHGERSQLVRQFTESVVRDVHPKDYLGEILAIRNLFVQPSPTRPGAALFRYTNDPRHVELVKTPERCVREVLMFGSCLLDCDEVSCLAGTMCVVIGREVEFVAMGFSPRELSHVAVRVKEPKSSAWIVLDGVAGPREKEASQKAQEVLAWAPRQNRAVLKWSLD